MNGTMLIAGRELKSFFRSPLGFGAAAAALLIDGIWFMAMAMGKPGAKQVSAQVLIEFFNGLSGVTMILAVLLSMRTFAHEHEHGTLVLLRTSPLSDRQLVAGKFLAVFGAVAAITMMSAYIPALIFFRGKVSLGHIGVGYLGILLLGGATIAVGTFGSALAKNQIVAILIGALTMAVLLLLWMLAKVTEPPISGFIEGLAIHHLRQRDFMTGVLRIENVIYYCGVAFFFLLAATKTLEARRWR